MNIAEIIKSNIMVAKYMNWQHPKPEGHWKWLIDGETFANEGINLHKDWNRIMSVIEKIETGNFGFRLCRKRVEVFYDDTKEVVFSVKEESRIKSAYVAIVWFVQNNIDKKTRS